MGIVLVLVGQAVQFDVPPGLRHHSQCSIPPIVGNSSHNCLSDLYPSNSSSPDDLVDTPKDLTFALLIYVGIGVAVLILLVVAFRPKLKRLEVEKRAQMLAKLQQETPSTSVSSVDLGASESVDPGRIKLGDASPLSIRLKKTKLSENNTRL